MGDKNLSSLVEDIYSLLESGGARIDAVKLAECIKQKLESKHIPELRMSNFGTPCERKLWYTINQPDKAEPLSGDVLIKFMIGDICEEVVLSLAGAAGHSVERRQEEVVLAGVKGHIDAVVDGAIVDVKSASSRSFDKFKYGTIKSDDPFGYVDQLSLYGAATQSKEAAFIAIDKQHGTLAIDKHSLPDRDWDAEVKSKKEMLALSLPPPRSYVPVLEGKSGNEVIPTPCSYCQFKHTCWKNLRSFKYSNGVKHFTKVVRTPDVEEVTNKS